MATSTTFSSGFIFIDGKLREILRKLTFPHFSKTHNIILYNLSEKGGIEKTEWYIAVVCTINKICIGENTSRDTSEEPQKP